MDNGFQKTNILQKPNVSVTVNLLSTLSFSSLTKSMWHFKVDVAKGRSAGGGGGGRGRGGGGRGRGRGGYGDRMEGGGGGYGRGGGYSRGYGGGGGGYGGERRGGGRKYKFSLSPKEKYKNYRRQCRHLKKLTCKGTLLQVFICLRLRTPYALPPPYTQCIRVYSVPFHTGKGRGGAEPERRLEGQQFTKLRRKYQHDLLYRQSINFDKHLPQSPFIGE
jgi:hypothetical protein